MLIGGETVVGAGRDERQATLPKLQLVSVDVEHAAPLEHDVELVLCIQQPMVRLRCDERINEDLEPCRLVDDLVSTVTGAEAGFGPGDVESVSWFDYSTLQLVAQRRHCSVLRVVESFMTCSQFSVHASDSARLGDVSEDRREHLMELVVTCGVVQRAAAVRDQQPCTCDCTRRGSPLGILQRSSDFEEQVDFRAKLQPIQEWRATSVRTPHFLSERPQGATDDLALGSGELLDAPIECGWVRRTHLGKPSVCSVSQLLSGRIGA
jgi:hypothetical protein